MPKRKGKKPPRRHPSDMRAVEGEAPKAQKLGYSPWQKSALWNRLEKFIGADYWIDEVIAEMQRREIPHTLKQLRRKLASLKIYPPPVERKHNAHRECWCKQCRARRSWPFYYVKDGQAYEHHLERQAMDDEAIEDEGLREERGRLDIESPGVVVDMRDRLSRRRRHGQKAA